MFIYIILSGLLLYLYFVKGDITIIAAFVVVVVGTLIIKDGDTIEGIKGNGNGKGKGKRSGTGTGAGKGNCSKTGFTAPNIKNNDIKGSLDNALKNIQTVADEHWPFEDINGQNSKNDKAKSAFEEINNNVFMKTEIKKINDDKDSQEACFSFALGSAMVYEAFITKPDEKKQKGFLKDFDDKFLTKALKGGDLYLTLLKNNKEHLKKEYKAADTAFDKNIENLLDYMICLCKQWISIWKAVQKAKESANE